jgi:DNA-binding beta-propeller fold protein YncE
MPDGDGEIKIFDPSNNTATKITVSSGTLRTIGAVLAPNGKIYCIPFGGNSFAWFDPSDNSFSTFGAFTPSTNITYPTGSSYFGGVLGPNGKIYTVPYNHSLLRVVDPENDTVSVIATVTGSQKYGGGSLGPDGNIYMFPNYATNILVINTLNNNVFNINFLTNPIYNRAGQ